MKDLAARVDAMRIEKGWTKTELARRCGLHKQHVYKLLTGGRTHPRAETVVVLARAFGVTPNDILGWDEDTESEMVAAAMA